MLLLPFLLLLLLLSSWLLLFQITLHTLYVAPECTEVAFICLLHHTAVVGIERESEREWGGRGEGGVDIG